MLERIKVAARLINEANKRFNMATSKENRLMAHAIAKAAGLYSARWEPANAAMQIDHETGRITVCVLLVEDDAFRVAYIPIDNFKEIMEAF